MTALNETHDPALASWVESANARGGDFPIQNLPFAVFRRREGHEAFRVGVAIGDQIFDIGAAQAAGAFSGLAARAAAACTASTLNGFMATGPEAWSALRLALSALRKGSTPSEMLRGCLVAQAEAEHAMPAHVGDYTDFYTSIHHATSVGKLFRPDNPLLPNYKWVPIGYHGRSSTIGISGQTFARPVSQPSRLARSSLPSVRANGSTMSSSWACSSALAIRRVSRFRSARPSATFSDFAC